MFLLRHKRHKDDQAVRMGAQSRFKDLREERRGTWLGMENQGPRNYKRESEVSREVLKIEIPYDPQAYAREIYSSFILPVVTMLVTFSTYVRYYSICAPRILTMP